MTLAMLETTPSENCSPAVNDLPVNDASVNEVRLVGRISAIGEPIALPSGDSLVNLRLVVPRDQPVGRRDADSARRPGVDTIDVACWSAEMQTLAAEVGVGGHAQITGVLRRRFFRSAAGLASRYEVEARGIRPALPPASALPEELGGGDSPGVPQ